ncbi:MAG TPA: hypothetical protein VGV89_10440 [Thermoplasmata archaeon]|nr:hypothetical protein [Thermoplasmata archaeon]
MSQADVHLLLGELGGRATVAQLVALAIQRGQFRDRATARATLYSNLLKLRSKGAVRSVRLSGRNGSRRGDSLVAWEIAPPADSPLVAAVSVSPRRRSGYPQWLEARAAAAEGGR